jgi:hypothetical protein
VRIRSKCTKFLFKFFRFKVSFKFFLTVFH